MADGTVVGKPILTICVKSVVAIAILMFAILKQFMGVLYTN
ncbi:hypothetical protein APA_4308 [Pseudanabaena sp. lw0831]|nr:hypothetical protein APA_4308 [Pseudanabaena sp. lw0831]